MTIRRFALDIYEPECPMTEDIRGEWVRAIDYERLYKALEMIATGRSPGNERMEKAIMRQIAREAIEMEP